MLLHLVLVQRLLRRHRSRLQVKRDEASKRSSYRGYCPMNSINRTPLISSGWVLFDRMGAIITAWHLIDEALRQDFSSFSLRPFRPSIYIGGVFGVIRSRLLLASAFSGLDVNEDA